MRTGRPGRSHTSFSILCIGMFFCLEVRAIDRKSIWASAGVAVAGNSFSLMNHRNHRPDGILSGKWECQKLYFLFGEWSIDVVLLHKEVATTAAAAVINRWIIKIKIKTNGIWRVSMPWPLHSKNSHSHAVRWALIARTLNTRRQRQRSNKRARERTHHEKHWNSSPLTVCPVLVDNNIEWPGPLFWFLFFSFYLCSFCAVVAVVGFGVSCVLFLRDSLFVHIFILCFRALCGHGAGAFTRTICVRVCVCVTMNAAISFETYAVDGLCSDVIP